MSLPERLGAYSVERELGSGAMGTVYLARAQSGAEVAVKVFRREVGLDEGALHRIQRQAESAYTLRHRNIIEVLDQGIEGGQHYVVTEHLKGQCLSEKMGSPLAWREAVSITLGCLKALNYAHEQGVVHRNLKPSNIFIDSEGEVVLTDFAEGYFNQGKNFTSSGGLGSALGRPEYMAPELFEDVPVQPKVDVYACAAILYEMLTGEQPYRAARLAETLKNILFKTITPPDKILSDLPAGLSEAVMRGLERQPHERPGASLLQRLLSEVLRENPEPEPLTPSPLSEEVIEEEVQPEDPALSAPQTREVHTAVLLVVHPRQDQHSRMSALMMDQGALFLQWFGVEVIAQFSSAAQALACAQAIRSEFSADLQSLTMAVATGSLDTDPEYARRRPDLGEFACPAVELGHALLDACPSGHLRCCPRSHSAAPEGMAFQESAPGVFEYASLPAAREAPPATLPPSEPEEARPLSLADRLGDAPKRRARIEQFLPTTDSRIKTMPVMVSVEEKRSRKPWLALVVLLLMAVGGFYWKSQQKGSLILICTPAKVEIKVLDTKQRLLVERNKPVSLSTGKHRLTIWAAGFKSAQAEVVILKDQETNLEIKLQKVPKKKPKRK